MSAKRVAAKATKAAGKVQTTAGGREIAFRGDRLRLLREKMGWTQTELAYRAGMSGANVSALEIQPQKKGASDVVTKRFAILFRVSADYLLGLSDDPAPRD